MGFPTGLFLIYFASCRGNSGFVWIFSTVLQIIPAQRLAVLFQAAWHRDEVCNTDDLKCHTYAMSEMKKKKLENQRLFILQSHLISIMIDSYVPSYSVYR